MAIENNTLDNDTDEVTTSIHHYARGDLVAINGYDFAVVLEPYQHKKFVKIVTVRKDGKREIGHYLIEAIGGPQQERLASLIIFYDRCADFFDGSKISHDESEIETLIEATGAEVFEILRSTATTIRQFDSPTNYSRARVLLDFAERSGAKQAEIEQCRAAIDTAKEASRAQLDLSRYYRRLREARYDPTVRVFDGGVHFGLKVSASDRPVEADEVEDVDIDFVLRVDYARSVWEARPASDMPVQFQYVPLGV